MAVLVLFSGAEGIPEGHTYYSRPYGFEFAIGGTKLFDRALAETCGRPTDNDGADFAELFCAVENIHLDRWHNADPKPFTVQALPEADNTPVITPDPVPVDNAPDTGEETVN